MYDRNRRDCTIGHSFFYLLLGLLIYFFEKRVGRLAYKNKYNWKYFGVGWSKIKLFVYYADIIDIYYFF